MKYLGVGFSYSFLFRDQHHIEPGGNTQRLQLPLLAFGRTVRDDAEFDAVGPQLLQCDARVLDSSHWRHTMSRSSRSGVQ